jgi:hypothetical protein
MRDYLLPRRPYNIILLMPSDVTYLKLHGDCMLGMFSEGLRVRPISGRTSKDGDAEDGLQGARVLQGGHGIERVRFAVLGTP